MLNTEKQNSAFLVAFTDASHGVGKRSSGSVILMPEDQSQLLSVHVASYGQSNRGTVHSEFLASVDALHIAPKGSLKALYSDCTASVNRLKKYKINIDAASTDKMLSVEDVKRLREGLARHPDIEIAYQRRNKPGMKIADKFSRMARGLPYGIQALQIPKDKNLQDQLNELYPLCHKVHALQREESVNTVVRFIEKWAFPSAAEPALAEV